MFCPFHEDAKRSAGVNLDMGLWQCRVGCGKGTVTDLINRISAMMEEDGPQKSATSSGGFDEADTAKIMDMESERSKRTGQARRTPPSDETILVWHSNLMENLDRLEAFVNKRGIREATLEKFKIGWSDEARAYTIPIYSHDDKLLNVRYYRMAGDAGDTKIWSHAGMDANAIFPESVLKENDTIVICEGEWDALVANQSGFPAVTGTTGATQWQKKWNRKFTDKTVYVCYDRDAAGDKGAQKVVSELRGIARAVYICELPLPWTERHGQDVTDFFHVHGRSAEDFRAVIRDAKAMSVPRDGSALEVSVKESYNPSLSGQKLNMTVSVVGRALSSHLLPGQAKFSCSINAGKICHGCPMANNDGEMELEIKPQDPVILKMRDVNEKVRDEVLREYLGAHKCGRMEIEPDNWLSTEMLLVRTSVEQSDEESEGDFASRTVINVGRYDTEANRTVRMTGTTFPSPKEQESVFQAWEMEPVESSLDNYEVTDEDIQKMMAFRPKPGQTVLKKLGEIARDLSVNVTRIINRNDMHIAMDLTWHSVIAFDFAGAPMDRGWLELLVVGDARTGKSEAATKLSKHYRFGKIVSCESASIPGLLGAVKPMSGSKNWTLEWGAIPLNDRRLVVLDEVGGLTTDQIGQMSSMRSSGIAEIVKAEAERTRARTRLVWLSNPRDNRHGMAGYMYGVNAIAPLIGNQEDIARFDFAMSVSTDDVELSAINRRTAKVINHTYTSDLCHTLLKWVWSRRRDQVVWEEDAVDAVYESSMELGRQYVPDPPLIQGQNVRGKIARIAAAMAARTFSTDAKCVNLIIKREHVEAAVEFLNYLYSRPGFGYKEISVRAKEEERKAVEMMDDVKAYLYARKGLARFLINTSGQFRRQQMEEMLNLSREEANVIIQKLSSMRMIASASDWDYKITPHLNTILREIKE